MRKLVLVHHLKENYTVSYSIMILYKMFYYEKISKIMNEGGYEIVTMYNYLSEDDKKIIMNVEKNYEKDDNYFKEKLVNSFDKFLNEDFSKSEDYNNSILIGFHPIGFDRILNKKNLKEIKKRNATTIMWHDDLHSFNKHHNLPINKVSIDKRFDNVDIILTPSTKYFENLKSPYLSKSIFSFYCFDERFFDKLNKKWEDRNNKIILSGSASPKYPIRSQLLNYYRDNLKNNKCQEENIAKYIYYYSYPTSDRLKNEKKTGLNYYNELSNYKAAFLSFLSKPTNFPLAKIIEILASGTLAFMERNNYLDIMGFKEFVHYVPIKTDKQGNFDFKELNYYTKYLTNNEGKRIANDGCEYVRKNYTMENKSKELIKIMNKY